MDTNTPAAAGTAERTAIAKYNDAIKAELASRLKTQPDVIDTRRDEREAEIQVLRGEIETIVERIATEYSQAADMQSKYEAILLSDIIEATSLHAAIAVSRDRAAQLESQRADKLRKIDVLVAEGQRIAAAAERVVESNRIIQLSNASKDEAGTLVQSIAKELERLREIYWELQPYPHEVSEANLQRLTTTAWVIEERFRDLVLGKIHGDWNWLRYKP